MREASRLTVIPVSAPVMRGTDSGRPVNGVLADIVVQPAAPRPGSHGATVEMRSHPCQYV